VSLRWGTRETYTTTLARNGQKLPMVTCYEGFGPGARLTEHPPSYVYTLGSDSICQDRMASLRRSPRLMDTENHTSAPPKTRAPCNATTTTTTTTCYPSKEMTL
jgi:hypothetical protein